MIVFCLSEGAAFGLIEAIRRPEINYTYKVSLDQETRMWWIDEYRNERPLGGKVVCSYIQSSLLGATHIIPRNHS